MVLMAGPVKGGSPHPAHLPHLPHWVALQASHPGEPFPALGFLLVKHGGGRCGCAHVCGADIGEGASSVLRMFVLACLAQYRGRSSPRSAGDEHVVLDCHISLAILGSLPSSLLHCSSSLAPFTPCLLSLSLCTPA